MLKDGSITITRGHSAELVKAQCSLDMRLSFSQWTINWNRLSDDCINASCRIC